MGDLHSLTYTSNLHSSSLGWDFHGLGVFNSDISHFMDTTTPPFLSPNFYDFDHSTGYLQDAFFEFNDRTKRRRLLFDHQFDRTSNSIEQQSYWESNQADDYPENTSYLSQMTGSSEIFEVKTTEAEAEEEMSVSEVFDYASSSPKYSSDTTNFIPTKDHHRDEECDGETGKREIMTRVVYPFAVVKPGGIEGDLTLNDINRRILMTPTRPVKHPVGDYALRPVVSSPHGLGLSGKSVVALTRLHTRGHRGTITIIRTKG